jgi:hypothetical protein
MRQIKIGTAIAYLHIFWPDFEEVEGSIFIANDQPKSTSDLQHGLDRTGMEAFYNHTHMIDLFKHNSCRQPIDEYDEKFFDYDHPDFLSLCELGKTLAQMWFQKLQIDFPKYDFRVYYTRDDNPVVRFHRVRPDELNWIDEGQYIEEIKRGEVVIYDTRKTLSKNRGT